MKTSPDEIENRIAEIDPDVEFLAVENAAMLQATVDAAGRGDLVIPIAHTFRLSELGEGHKRAAAGQVGGKIIFVP